MSGPEIRLADVHTWIHRAVRGGPDVHAAAAALGVAPGRLAIYRRFVRGHVRSAVAANFGLTRAATAPAAWDALVDRYVDAHPAHHWRLDDAAAAFPAWLADVAALDAPRRALAELEWTLAEVRHDPTPWPAVPAGGWALNPTLAILQSPFALVPWAIALGRGEPAPPPPAAESLVLACRRPADEVTVFHAGHPDWLFAIKVAHDGLTVAEAAALSGQPAAAVRAALDGAVDASLLLKG